MDEGVLTAEQVAAYLHVRPVTIYRWCREGRLPCIKLGRVWRIQRAALDDFLAHPPSLTLTAQLHPFFTVPDHVIAVAQDTQLLHRLDTAFFQLGEARGDVLVKFHVGEPATAEQLRADFTRDGLDVRRLERERRFRFVEDADPLHGRADALRRTLSELTDNARSRAIWAAFDWAERVDLEEALRQQQGLAAAVDMSQLVIKTSVLEQVVDAWPGGMVRRAQHLHRGMIWLSEDRLALSRNVPTPPT